MTEYDRISIDDLKESKPIHPVPPFPRPRFKMKYLPALTLAVYFASLSVAGVGGSYQHAARRLDEGDSIKQIRKDEYEFFCWSDWNENPANRFFGQFLFETGEIGRTAAYVNHEAGQFFDRML